VRLPREERLASERMAGDPLLLQDVRVRVVARAGTDTSALRSVLEASGATVTIADTGAGNDPVPESRADVAVIDEGPERWRLQFPPSADASQSLGKDASPSDVVRRIARMLDPSYAR
jgi:hypothetical protein